MANLELRERFFGSGLVGTVRLEPGEHYSLQTAFVRSFERATGSVAGIQSDLARLGWSIDQIPALVSSLEQAVVVRLDQQATFLASQLSVLTSIDAALRSPAKVRAAERMADASGLLRTGRYERALMCAREAMDGDPNHPGGFAAAGFALTGLGRMHEAASHFLEAQAATNQTKEAMKFATFAAKCLLVEGETGQARAILESAVREWPGHSYAGLLYDVAIACALDDDPATAAEYLEKAIRVNFRFAQMAFVEPTFSEMGEVLHRVVTVSEELARKRTSEAERRAAEAKRREREAKELGGHGAQFRERLRQVKARVYEDDWASNNQLRVLYDRASTAVARVPEVVKPTEGDLSAARIALEDADTALSRLVEEADRVVALDVEEPEPVEEPGPPVGELDRVIAVNRERVQRKGKTNAVLRFLRARK